MLSAEADALSRTPEAKQPRTWQVGLREVIRPVIASLVPQAPSVRIDRGDWL